eukprot:gene12499-14671_t
MTQTTYRRFGIEVYYSDDDDNNVVVETKGLRLSVLPFFFKNRVDIAPVSKLVPVPSSFAVLEDAGIPRQLNQSVFDILSRARYLATLSHEHLVEFIAAEPSPKHHDKDVVAMFAYHVLKALAYLHANRITHRNLCTDNIKIDSRGHAKLSNYGLYHLSNEGENVSFPIGNLANWAPESVLRDMKGSSNPKGDVWALGCILLEATCGACPWADKDPLVVLNRITHLAGLPATQRYNIETKEFEVAESVGQASDNLDRTNMDLFLDALNESGPYGALDEGLRQVISHCLTPDASSRPSSAELLDHPFFDSLRHSDPFAPEWVERPAIKSLELPDDLSPRDSVAVKREHDIFSGAELYYLWRLAGGNLERELVSQGLAKPSPSVHKLPLFVPLSREDARIFSGRGISSVLYNASICALSIDSLVPKFRAAYVARVKLVEEMSGGDGYLFTQNRSSASRADDLIYQIVRLREFHTSLHAYSADPIQAQPAIVRLAKYGIPPLLRGAIWAAILGVNDAEASAAFSAIDLDARGPNDKQFELDIPRCHQYHPLLSSPKGHVQLFRVLKAWSLQRSGEAGCYWQGLDNVASPFVVHCFHDESKAFGCLKSFVDKYLKILYVPNNYAALNDIMLTYQQLLSYHDPELSVHLHDVQLEPNLYAIPWFITIFAHLLPIDKIDILWDTILLGPSSFPFFFAVSIMTQFRTLMLKSNLENCIKALSKIPSCDIYQCVTDALDKFNITPLSTTISKFVHNTDEELWWMQEVPIEVKKNELFPRIGIHDLINNQSAKILDIRPPAQFQQCHYPNSVNINWLSISNAISGTGGGFSVRKNHTQFEPYRGQQIVVIGPRGSNDGIDFCNQLVKWKYPYVSLLNGGMDALEHGAQTLLLPKGARPNYNSDISSNKLHIH